MSKPCKLSCIALSLFLITAMSATISPAAEETTTAAQPAVSDPATAPAQPAEAPAAAVPAVEPKPAAPLAALPEFLKPSAATVTRIGYVDIIRIGQDSSRGKTLQSQMKTRLEKLKSQVTSKQKQLEKQKTAIQEKLATLSPDQRAAKAREFEKKVTEFQKFVQKGEKDMQALQEELTRKLADEVKAAAANYGKSAGFTAIVVNRDILYQGSDVATQDVTDELIRLVDGAKGK
jgi:outer membrane protein